MTGTVGLLVGGRTLSSSSGPVSVGVRVPPSGPRRVAFRRRNLTGSPERSAVRPVIRRRHICFLTELGALHGCRWPAALREFGQPVIGRTRGALPVPTHRSAIAALVGRLARLGWTRIGSP